MIVAEAGGLARLLQQPEPQLILGRLLQIVVILVAATLAYRAIGILTRRLEREIDDPDPASKRAREQRARTLASILRNIGFVAALVLAGLMILAQFVEIAPLLVSVGVLGLVISFGAQSLVKDVITGVFMLVEGQFAIGDVVRIGDTGGLVEKITLRTIVLRDLHGVVHVIPNGEVSRLSNLTKGWSRAVLDVGVAYKEDVDHVMEVLRDVGRELFDDPAWRPVMIDPPEVPGVDSFGDSAVVIRMMAKTLPLKQWELARELRRRIKNRFDAEGIEIPFPHRTIYWGTDQAPADAPPENTENDVAPTV